jgi:filamentous hemagglutinin
LNNELPKTQSQVQPQITIKSKGPSGKKVRLDAVGTENETGGIKLSDGKASDTAGLTPNQKIVYPELETHGGVVRGKGKPPYTGGTKIPPTKVDIIRPKKKP